MNNIFITHNSAFQIYRTLRNVYPHTLDLKKTSICPKKNESFYTKDIDTNFLKYYGLDNLMIDISVAKSSTIRKSNKIIFHKVQEAFPRNSFYKLQNNIYVSCPELTFCNMAETLPFYKLALLGLELCGTYSIDKQDETGFINNILPITTAHKIQNYIQSYKQIKKIRQIKKAEEVAKWLTDFSASPQESRLYVLLSAPRHNGGYAVKNLQFNVPINLSKEAIKLCNQKIVIPDLSNTKNKISIEYDSSAFHDINAQNQKDKLRINSLNHEGWKTFTFVKKHFHDIYAFRRMALDILKANKQDPRINTRNFEVKHSALYSSLTKYNIN